MKTCKRGHVLSRGAYRWQSGRERSDGTITKTKVCLACCRVRQQRRSRGLPVADMRKA